MKSSQAKKEFEQKLETLRTEVQPALTENNLTEIVIYEKLLEILEKVEQIERKLEARQ
ncbi:MAG: hypothetical protein KBF42_00800 [Chitinophagales bacterium]|jgi:hypothetical protein|nr:hypothetical protein [Bacteroidota bacterium]MBK7569376.1 hypothetical protein [Bacteroidota bacterium]MBP8915281.1 hypothetical protein [Chitinophagales bacterium]MBP9219894.1 hypothetical protein [Chitinophagales bacterium]MBP9794439.1 hypothetical protein [Chitinophagales bacterium]